MQSIISIIMQHTVVVSKPAVPASGLLQDVRELILSTRQTVARGVNAALLMLYWKVGERTRRNILKEKRAEYGERIVPTLPAQLVPEFGDGFSRRNMFRMVQFAEVFPDEKIVTTLSRELGWSHLVELLPLKKYLQPEFYAEMCRVEPEYLTELPPKNMLEQKLHEAVRLARARLEASPAQCRRILAPATPPAQEGGERKAMTFKAKLRPV